MSLSSKTELARALFRSTPPDSVTRISGTATADSSDGTVTVQLEDGDVIEVGTIGSVSSGDTVTIHVQRGEAQVIASEGWGDAMQAAVDEAQAIAEATGQHFWHDSNGAHVTEITQEQWAQSQTGHNILVNSYGMLLRDALTYLAAFSPSGVTFYDGGGNEEANITAKFGSNQAIVGADGSSRMVVDSTSIKGMNAASVPFFDLDYDGGQIAAVAERASLATSKVKLHNGSGYLMLATDVSDAIPGTQITMSGTGCTISFPSSMASTISIDSETGCTASYADGKATLLIPDKVFAVGTSSSYSASVRFLVGQFILDVSIAYSYDAAAGTVEGTVSTWGGGTLSFYNGTFRGTGKAVLFVQTTAPSITFGSRSGTAGGFSQAFGQGIIAQGDAQTAIGKYNVADSTSALIVGNGTADNARSNALTVDWSGNVEAAGGLTLGTIDFIECGLTANTAAGTTATWTYVDVKLNSVVRSYGSGLSLATSGTDRYGVVVSKDGYYRISGYANVNAPSYLAVTVDGTTVSNIVFIQSGYNGAGLGSTVVKLTSGSVIKMRIERTGATDPTVGGTTLTRLSVERVG